MKFFCDVKWDHGQRQPQEALTTEKYVPFNLSAWPSIVIKYLLPLVHQLTPCPRALSSTPSSEIASDAATASCLAGDITSPSQAKGLNEQRSIPGIGLCVSTRAACQARASCKSWSQGLPRNAETVISIASIWVRQISCCITFLHTAEAILNTCAIHFVLHATRVLGRKVFCWHFGKRCGYNSSIWVGPSE